MKGMYFVFVDIESKDGSRATAYFTLEILRKDESERAKIEFVRQLNGSKAELLPAIQLVLDAYKKGKAKSLNPPQELNFWPFPKGYDFPNVNTIDDFLIYGVDAGLGNGIAAVPVGDKNDTFMLFELVRFIKGDSMEWGVPYVYFEAASTRRLRERSNDFMIALQSHIAFTQEAPKVMILYQEMMYPDLSPELTYMEYSFIINGDTEHLVGYINAIPIERYEEFLKLDIPNEKRGTRIANYSNQLALTAAVQDENIAWLTGQERENAEGLASLLKKLQAGTETIESVSKVQ